MGLTRDFKETIMERAHKDPEFAQALLDEALSLFLTGDAETSRLILRELVNATIGFEDLSTRIGSPSKSLHRMLSTRGNPSMDNLSRILSTITDVLNVSVETTVLKKKNRRTPKTASA